MTTAYLNRIETAVPPHDVHETFIAFIKSQLQGDNRKLALFHRMVERGGIDHRYSCLEPSGDLSGIGIDTEGLFRPGQFPDTAARMRLFEMHAPVLAARAVEKLGLGRMSRASLMSS